MSFVNVLKLGVLFSLVGWAIVSGHAHVGNLLPLSERRPGSDALFPAIAGGAVSAFFSFGGWWEAGKICREIRDPKRNLPLAYVGGVSLVTAVYLLVSAVFLGVLPIDKMTSNTAFVAQFGEALFGATGARVLSICVLICVCGGMAALSMAAPRVVYAMAQSGAFFPAFGRLSRRHTGECDPAPDRPCPRRASAWSIRPRPGLYHLLGSSVSRSHCLHIVQDT